MSIFTETLTLLRAIELHLLGGRESNFPLIENLKRFLWYPIKFLKLGIAEKTKSVSIWVFLSFSLLMLGASVVDTLGIAKTEVANIVLLSCAIVPIPLIIFAMPSMHNISGLSLSDIEFVELHLRTHGFNDEKDIELLKKSIKPIEERARSRVIALKWFTGSLWAGLIYTFSKSVEIPATTATQLTSHLFFNASLIFAVVTAYIVAWGYEASLDKLFRLIEFGCNDRCHYIQNTKRIT